MKQNSLYTLLVIITTITPCHSMINKCENKGGTNFEFTKTHPTAPKDSRHIYNNA